MEGEYMNSDNIENVDLEASEEEVSIANVKLNESGTASDSQVYFDENSTDDVVAKVKLLHDDFVSWLDAISSADKVFDGVMFPYVKGTPPRGNRFRSKRPKYDEAVEEADNNFYSTLNEIVNDISDYSSDNSLKLEQSVALEAANHVNYGDYDGEDSLDEDSEEDN